jgi:hypothetical protein
MTVELNNYLKQNYGGRSVKKTWLIFCLFSF